MSDEFGPWVEHDGGPRPVPRGTICHMVWETGDEFVGPAGVEQPGFQVSADEAPWGFPGPLIIRYRIRKPRGLTILENLIAEIPEEVAG